MKMLSKVEVIAPPGSVVYLLHEGDVLRVWVGAGGKEAPPEARRVWVPTGGKGNCVIQEAV